MQNDAEANVKYVIGIGQSLRVEIKNEKALSKPVKRWLIKPSRYKATLLCLRF